MKTQIMWAVEYSAVLVYVIDKAVGVGNSEEDGMKVKHYSRNS